MQFETCKSKRKTLNFRTLSTNKEYQNTGTMDEARHVNYQTTFIAVNAPLESLSYVRYFKLEVQSVMTP